MIPMKIYRFRTWDSHADQIKESRRWGTRDAIQNLIGGEIIERSETEVDESAIDSDGLTAMDFNPRPRVGFQGDPPK
jgi:hypothetical protein